MSVGTKNPKQAKTLSLTLILVESFSDLRNSKLLSFALALRAASASRVIMKQLK